MKPLNNSSSVIGVHMPIARKLTIARYPLRKILLGMVGGARMCHPNVVTTYVYTSVNMKKAITIITGMSKHPTSPLTGHLKPNSDHDTFLSNLSGVHMIPITISPAAILNITSLSPCIAEGSKEMP
jgi:hypothetical protein